MVLVGTAGSGKSSWLIHGLQKLETKYPLSLPIEGQRDSWIACKKAISQGFHPPPTSSVPSKAWCVDLATRKARRRLYVYDTSGQEVADQTMLLRHQSFRHVDCLVLALDPFSLPAVYNRHGEAVRAIRPPVRPAFQAFGMEHLWAVLSTLEHCHVQPKGSRWNILVAVMLTKMNVLGLMRKIGEPDATLEQVDHNCRQQLASWDSGDLVKVLDNHFSRVHYFVPTPIGQGVFSSDQPLLWALDAV